MITIIDYGVGNLFSLSSSLSYLGLENKVSRDPEDLRKADHIILPGVGAYGDAIAKLRGSGMASRCWMKQKQANRSWESASECSFSLIKAMNTASIRVWD